MFVFIFHYRQTDLLVNRNPAPVTVTIDYALYNLQCIDLGLYSKIIIHFSFAANKVEVFSYLC